MDLEDQRDVELSTLSAIFPEIHRLHEDDPYTVVLQVPVNPTKAVTVFFPAATEGQAVDPTAPQNASEGTSGNTDSHELAHLPAVRLQFSLPSSYPAQKPPMVNVSTSPSWLPADTAKKLEDECGRLWEELGRDLVVFTYIDHVQQSADDVFGLVSDSGALEISPEHKIAVLDYDIEAKRAAFEKETFECGVCLDPKKGVKCHRMLDCGHVFCIQCLQGFYNNAIKEGDLSSIRCLEPSCAKERETAQAPGSKKRRKPRTFISPSELLQIPLESEMVKRYVTLKYKTELESDKNTIYCPRPWCQGAARSKKHKKPEGFQLHEAEDNSDEDEQPAADSAEASRPKLKPFKPEDTLAVCEDCGFAFCSRCEQGWHGEFVVCTPKRDNEELNEEEKASLDFISLHTTPCPTCACPAQKTHGCNHMICYKCQTHFCYLCSAWLDPLNPYQHFNQMPNGRVTSCYMRLWELEEGDENGQNVFAGGRAAQEAAAIQQQEIEAIGLGGELHDLDEAPVGDIGDDVVVERPQDNVRAVREGVVLPGQVGVALEGPLVLRLDVGPRQDGLAQQEAAALPAPRQQPQARGQNQDRGNPGGVRQHQLQPRLRQRGQRGRGGRGRGGGHHQIPNHQRPNEGGQVFARRDRHLNERMQEGGGGGHPDQLEDVEAAWVRHFVHLALEDNEHLLDEE